MGVFSIGGAEGWWGGGGGGGEGVLSEETDRPTESESKWFIEKGHGPRERESENSNSKTLFYKDCRVERERERERGRREREREMCSAWRVLGFGGAWGGVGGWGVSTKREGANSSAQ